MQVHIFLGKCVWRMMTISYNEQIIFPGSRKDKPDFQEELLDKDKLKI